MAAISKHIRRLRTARHMTQEDLAQRLFVTRQAVSAWETGKALPDVETLERIAAALGADITEVLYGAAQSPDLRRQRRRWLLTGFALAAARAALYLLAAESGLLGTWRDGLLYQYWSQDYAVTSAEVPGSYCLELDLNDLDSNVGKVLYEDASGCQIVVCALEPAAASLGEYGLVFRAQGVYARSGGQLVSGCYDRQLDKFARSLETSFSAEVTLGGLTLPAGSGCGLSSLEKDGNRFGFYVFPPEAYTGREFALSEELAAQDGHVTVSVSGLNRMSTRRADHLLPFS